MNKLKRKEQLEYKNPKESTDRVRLVLTYSAQLPNVHSILKTQQNIIMSVQQTKDYIQGTTGSSLQKEVKHQRHSSSTKKQYTYYPPPSRARGLCACRRNRCAMCKHVIEQDTLQTPDGKEM